MKHGLAQEMRPADVAGSPYGLVCGTYVTGDEIVGVIPKDGGRAKAERGE